MARLLIVGTTTEEWNDIFHSLYPQIADHIQKNNYDHIVGTTFIQGNSNFPDRLSFHGSFTHFPTLLEPLVEHVFPKTTYSAFKDPALLAFIKEHNIDEFFFCGTQTDAGILATAFDAFDMGLQFTILIDLCMTKNHMQDFAAKYIIQRNLQRNISTVWDNWE